MTILGLVGGLGPGSTIDYYRRILDAWEREAPGTAPSIVIDSLDVRHALLGTRFTMEAPFYTEVFARQGVVALVERLRDEQGAQGVILGGTELPLLLPGETIAGLPALDTTALHVAAIVARLRGADVHGGAAAPARS